MRRRLVFSPTAERILHMATSTARKTNPESYIPANELASDLDYMSSRPADPNPQYLPPRSPPFKPSTGFLVLGILAVLAIIVAVSMSTSERMIAPSGSDSTFTQPVQPIPPSLPDATDQNQTTNPLTPAPAPSVEQPAPPAGQQATPPAAEQPVAPALSTISAQPGTGTTSP